MTYLFSICVKTENDFYAIWLLSKHALLPRFYFLFLPQKLWEIQRFKADRNFWRTLYVSWNQLRQTATDADAFVRVDAPIIDAAVQYAEQGLCNGRGSVRPPVCPVARQLLRHVAGLQLSAPRAGHIDR